MSLNKRSILVTGGAGFLGTALVKTLLEETHATTITVLDNLFNGRLEHIAGSPRVEFREVDLTDQEAVNRVVSDTLPNIVLHLGAIHFIPYCNRHPVQTLQVNVVGTQNVLEACRRHEPEKLIIASTAAVYPICDQANREEDAVGPIDIYGLSKWTNEKQLEQYAAQTNTECCAARLFNLYGPGETNPHAIPAILDQVAAGETEIAVGNIKPKRDYLYVTDAARALRTMAEKSTGGFRVYNVGTGQEHSVEEIIHELSRIAGRALAISVDPERVRSVDRMHLLSDPSRIGAELGWRPQYTLCNGLTALWQHHTAHGKKPQAICS